MTDLPARPSLDHLRREARDLLRAAQAGDPAAAGRIRAVSAARTLAPPASAPTGPPRRTSWPVTPACPAGLARTSRPRQ